MSKLVEHLFERFVTFIFVSNNVGTYTVLTNDNSTAWLKFYSYKYILKH